LIDSPEFEFIDEHAVDLLRKQVGLAGAMLAHEALSTLGHNRVRDRIVEMIGLDGLEHALMFDQTLYTDSLTVPEFQRLIRGVQNDNTRVLFEVKGQSIEFRLLLDKEQLIQLYVPFTINKNGAWISGKPYEGERFHKKEGVSLRFGQRRPKKSREIATSTNTWVDFKGAGVFIEETS